ncbi:Uncharacterized membrane protein [Kaistia soli DSM 19436]|uniref:Uncharacterized membrane protein n=1 Tax=Kaistia soli DSM 19436 TaxID=1122133 RepID=A0A1M4XMV2_9HYPH|nr:PACE efflux transporter [Kaistia soli]SHE94593.1 Uncharacterized membrane protein [Kaistia soli DSM 19436]
MRTTRDRIRHTISFEIIGLLIATPLAALAFGLPLADVGVVGLGTSLAAALWNYVYNLGFDHALVRLKGDTSRGVPLRVLHAVLFEGGLMIMLMPIIAWYLGISLFEALAMDVSFALFYMGYAFVFNLAYDRLFPIEGGRASIAA